METLLNSQTDQRISEEIRQLDFERIKFKLSLKKNDDGLEWSKEKVPTLFNFD